MKRILIGMICDGKAGGIDKYLLNFYESVRSDDLCVDFLTNKKDPELEERLKKTGANLYEIPSLKNPIGQYREVKKLIQVNGYDIVYMNVSTALVFPVLKAAHDCRVVKVIVHSHSAGYDCNNAPKRKVFTLLHNLCKPLVCKYANRYLTCSDKAAEWLFTKAALQKRRATYVQNTVNVQAFSFDLTKRGEIREKLGLYDKFVIGNVGNMFFQKNQLFLLDVFHVISAHEPQAHLVIIGDGFLREKIEQKVTSLKLNEKVTLIKRADISEGYMSAFDVFALPSNFEGMPIVSVEAQCSHLPCVLSDTISHEACISNMCRFAPITSADIFAKAVLDFKNVDRNNFKILNDLDTFSSAAQQAFLKRIVD